MSTRNDFPTEGIAIAHIMVVKDLQLSRRWYEEVLGATLTGEYGGTSAEPLEDRSHVSHSVTIRVPDCRAAYKVLLDRGARFLTEPYDWPGEVRCFFFDPDGHLFEISERK